jgi:hypothetical protein
MCEYNVYVLMQSFCLQEWGYEPIASYKPVTEPVTGAERFLEADPTDVFLSGKFAQIPLITGMTRDEFSYKALRKYILRFLSF